jgi:hypothetical protein
MLNVLWINGDPKLYTLAKSEYYFIYRFFWKSEKIFILAKSEYLFGLYDAWFQKKNW